MALIKPRKENCVLTYSSVLTVKTNTKQLAMTVFLGNTDSIKSGIQKNLKSSQKSEPTQFAYLWTRVNNDYKIFKTFFTEYLKEQASH